MAFNAQAAQATPSSGLQHSFANSPAPQDHVAPATFATNDAIRNVSPSSVLSAGDAAGRKMKRTVAAKQPVKRSPYGQAPPPWATSLLGGRASLGSMTRTPSSTQGPAAQPNSIVDTSGDTPSTDFSIRQSGSESSGPSRSRSPEPARIETDIDQSEPEGLLAAKLETTSSEGTPGIDMAGKKQTLAEHAKIQALQDTWASGGLAPGTPGIAESAGEKDWLGGVSLHGDSASTSRKRAMPGNMASDETNKRRMTAVPVPVIPNKASFDQTSSTSELMTTERDLMNAVYAADADQATDDDQTAEERESNVSEPRTASIDIEADDPFSQGFGEFHVTKGPDPRGYLQWRSPQGTESSCGTILPTNYQLYPNPEYPLICPVRNCRTLFRKMNSLGAHFCAKHRSCKFNDNLDGTLSFVDYYKKAGARYTPPIVVSQKPLRGDEPPMPEPVPRLATATRPLPLKAMITSPHQIRMPMVPMYQAASNPSLPVPPSSTQNEPPYSVPSTTRVVSTAPVSRSSAPVTSDVDEYPLPFPPLPRTDHSAVAPQAPPPTRSSHPPSATHAAPSAYSNGPPPPDSPPRRVTRHSLASKLVAEAGPSSLPAPAPNSLAGNPMPSNMLEMEDWEVAPGRLRDEQSESPTNVAFSNSYLTTNQAVTVSEDISFNVIVIKPGDSYHWPEEADKVRICSIATGKLKVKLDNAEAFLMGLNGMFKLKPGMACTVENRLYVDSVVHVTTVSYA
ncbi:ribosomal protein L27 [Colletotrichum tabaci]|uniref:Ribosomal protein L27 n=1 Tax=Colletotrichum tabaci TaxID=1209068 RepID=A0AAV9T2R0_9PEZI